MKFKWGWGIAILYSCFVVMIVTMAVGASRQSFDLVSNDYYGEELAYQKTIDAGKNQSNLSEPLKIQTNAQFVVIQFPAEFKNKFLKGNILFYSPVNSEWDKTIKINQSDDLMKINRTLLRKTRYTLKMNWETDGKKYYQQTDLDLN